MRIQTHHDSGILPEDYLPVGRHPAGKLVGRHLARQLHLPALCLCVEQDDSSRRVPQPAAGHPSRRAATHCNRRRHAHLAPNPGLESPDDPREESGTLDHVPLGRHVSL